MWLDLLRMKEHDTMARRNNIGEYIMSSNASISLMPNGY